MIRYRLSAAIPIFLGIVGTTYGAPSHGSAPQQNPNFDYSVWTVALDGSLSILPSEFSKAKKVAVELAGREIVYNDIVWLLTIGGHAEPALSFAFPYTGSTNSQILRVLPQFEKVKQEYSDGVGALEQSATTTDLKSTIGQSLAILKTQPKPRRRYAVIISDFIQDVAGSKMTPHPPASSPNKPAAGMFVILLVAQPKQLYLQKLGISVSDLYELVSTEWAAYFRQMQASGVTVKPLDAVPDRHR